MIELKGSKSAAAKVAIVESSCCRSFICCDEDILNDCTLPQREQSSGAAVKGAEGVSTLRLLGCCSGEAKESSARGEQRHRLVSTDCWSLRIVSSCFC